MSGQILVIGEALIDEVHRGEEVARHPGGSPANVALGLARLDNEVALHSQWGTDADGELLERHLQASGVRPTESTRTEAATSRAIATLDEGGAADYTFHLTWDPQPLRPPADVSHAHTGSIATVIAPGADTVADIIAGLSDRATISLDPNARPSLMGEPGDAYRRIQALLAHADIVKASDEDIDWFTGGAPEREVVDGWLAGGASLVVVTRGAQGMSAYCANGEVSCPTLADHVADTVGAGDSLMGGLIDALARLDLLGASRRAALRALDLADLTEVITWASAISAITVSRDGANPPTTADVGDFLDVHQIPSALAGR